MPIDPQIALQVQQPASPIDLASKALTLKTLMGEQDTQKLQQQNAQLDLQTKQKAVADDYAITNTLKTADLSTEDGQK